MNNKGNSYTVFLSELHVHSPHWKCNEKLMKLAQFTSAALRAQRMARVCHSCWIHGEIITKKTKISHLIKN